MSNQEVTDAIRARTLDLEQFKPLMQVGWVAKGFVYGLIGLMTIPIALSGGSDGGGSGGSGGEQASRRGALDEIAEVPGGNILLVITAIGLFLYAAWRLTTALLPGDNSEAETWAHRIGWFFSAAVYGYLAYTSISFVLSDGGGSGSGGSGGESSSGGSGGQSSVEKISSTLLESTIGRWVLGIGALGALAVAGYFAYKGIAKKYLDEIDLGSASSAERTVLTNFGVIGWVGRSITVGLIGVLVLISAITADPDEAEGLDGALRSVADNWWGVILVLAAGIGLIAYGVHAAVSARHRRLLGP